MIEKLQKLISELKADKSIALQDYYLNDRLENRIKASKYLERSKAIDFFIQKLEKILNEVVV